MLRHDCTDCGRPARAGGRQCARCYQRRYRATPEGKRRHNDAVIRYNRRNPAKRRVWVHRYWQRIGLRVPELQDLRRAIKRLDASIQQASQEP